MQSSLDRSQCLFYFVSLFYFVPQEKNIAVKLARLEPIERQNIINMFGPVFVIINLSCYSSVLITKL